VTFGIAVAAMFGDVVSMFADAESLISPLSSVMKK